MPNNIEDGGPAFPAHRDFEDRFPGMSIRDYMAIHADQPGIAEIVTEAGLVYNNRGVWSDPNTCIAASFDAWWATISQVERFKLSARCRYRIADAMLAARKETPDQS